jgi:hypothetical protein
MNNRCELKATFALFWKNRRRSMKVKTAPRQRKENTHNLRNQTTVKKSLREKRKFFSNRGAIEVSVLFNLDVEALDDETLCSRLAISFSLCFTRFTRQERRVKKRK